ncbi:MAG: universal stress protein [Actinomycetota bacterium]
MSSNPIQPRAIVVGVNGSPSSDQALDWAADEAARRGLPLQVIHGFPHRDPMTRLGVGYTIDGLNDLAQVVRSNAISRVSGAHPDLVVTWAQPIDGPTPALVDASETADTVVIGARGLSRARGLIMGSVSLQVSARARCPVVVVHEQMSAPVGAPVVVGVDGSAASTNAIAYAFEQARSRGVGLTVVHAWWMDFIEGATGTGNWTVDWQAFAEVEQDLVTTSIAGWQDAYPEVTVGRHSVRGLPVQALIRQSENACLVVVGSRGRVGFGCLLLGSVSKGVMHGAQCPVVIVHDPNAPQIHPDVADTSFPPLVSIPTGRSGR